MAQQATEGEEGKEIQDRQTPQILRLKKSDLNANFTFLCDLGTLYRLSLLGILGSPANT